MPPGLYQIFLALPGHANVVEDLGRDKSVASILQNSALRLHSDFRLGLSGACKADQSPLKAKVAKKKGAQTRHSGVAQFKAVLTGVELASAER